jgi:hypothetical protein
MGLNEILFLGGEVLSRSVVLLTKCVQVQFFATQQSGRNFNYFVAKNCGNITASYAPKNKTSLSPEPLAVSVTQQHRHKNE